jgi:hypothetical protein
VDFRLRVEPVEERESAGVACCDSSWGSILAFDVYCPTSLLDVGMNCNAVLGDCKIK